MTLQQIAEQNYYVAVENGDITYEGTLCKKAGHTKRYTSNKKCIECHKQYIKTPKPIEQSLYNKYGITSKDWMRMYEEQNGICANPDCDFTHHSRWDEQGRNGFHVDHDHETGEVRGLLCSICNKLEGWIAKHPKRLMGLFEYKKMWDEGQQKKAA